MNKYNSNTIYIGNIIKHINKEKFILRKDVYLVYNQDTDTFCPLEFLNYIIDLDLNKNLTEEQKEEYKKIINENKYHYDDTDNSSDIYIDEKSIQIAFSKEKYNIHHK